MHARKIVLSVRDDIVCSSQVSLKSHIFDFLYFLDFRRDFVIWGYFPSHIFISSSVLF